MVFLSMIGLISAVILLIYLTMKGINIIIAALISSAVIVLTSGLNWETAFMDYYMTGFTDYFYSWFLVFLLGAIFGKIMQDTKSADSIANWIKNTIGPSRAVLAVVAAAAIMTYGGVSLFVVGFAVYPIAVSLFRAANLPHRFIPAALVFGSISFTMIAPGSPEIQNIIPTEFFGTKPTAGGFIGVLLALIIMVVGGWWLGRDVKKAVRNGETFSLPPGAKAKEEMAAVAEEDIEKAEEKLLPNFVAAILPLIVVIALLNILSFYMNPTAALLLALLVGISLLFLFMFKYVKAFWETLTAGTQNALVALANTCGVVGFGGVAAQATAFDSIVEALISIPGSPLLGLGIGVSVISGITGSASGGLAIALPILAPIYLGQGVNPGEMHRISALASGGLDSLPHNGYVVTTIRVICGETHTRAYRPILWISVVLPIMVLLLGVLLYSIF